MPRARDTGRPSLPHTHTLSHSRTLSLSHSLTLSLSHIPPFRRKKAVGHGLSDIRATMTNHCHKLNSGPVEDFRIDESGRASCPQGCFASLSIALSLTLTLSLKLTLTHTLSLSLTHSHSLSRSLSLTHTYPGRAGTWGCPGARRSSTGFPKPQTLNPKP